jgi:glycosyltransferase involved in cell wall biosynthesis
LVITTTHLYQKQLKMMGIKSDVFYTPSNFENYILNLEKNSKPNSVLKIGTFGNRDPTFLLQVIAQLEIKGLIFNFEFIGNYQPKYVRQIKEVTRKLQHVSISRSGKLTDANIVKHLSLLDAFILLEPVTENGGGGLNTKSGASATALCMGIPIFSTKGDFTEDEVFVKNSNYICLNHNDVTESTNIIFESLSDPGKLKVIGLNGKILYDQNFAWKQYVKKMQTLMLEKLHG